MPYKKVAINAAKKAGNILLKYNRKSIKTFAEGKHDLHTSADIESQNLITSLIKKEFPDHGFIVEEKGITEESNKLDYTWIIDPLDGTRFYSTNVPLYSVSIGLKHKNDIILGVVYSPATKELYVAEEGQGAYLNGRKIHVSEVDKLSKSRVLIDYKRNEEYVKKGADLYQKIAPQVSFAGAFACEVLEIVYVARGDYEANVCLSARLWDVAAAGLILKEAGGKITDLNGNNINLNKIEHSVVASNKKIHGLVLKLL